MHPDHWLLSSLCALCCCIWSCASSVESDEMSRSPMAEDTIRQPVTLSSPERAANTVQRGMASFSADEQHGRPTASGERYDMRQLVAAHPTLPFGTRVRVTRVETGQSVVVRIIDRGPFVKGRIIDLSFEAAKRLDFLDQGTAPVTISVAESPD